MTPEKEKIIPNRSNKQAPGLFDNPNNEEEGLMQTHWNILAD